MHVDWNSFAPLPALFGGIILGVAAVLYIHAHGRILGISGILGGLVRGKPGDWLWRLSFILGLVTSPLWARALLSVHPAQVIDADFPQLIVAGVLVGFGSRYGSGCTSGHGICGLSRLSPRSLLATASFMVTGFVTVFVLRHIF